MIKIYVTLIYNFIDIFKLHMRDIYIKRMPEGHSRKYHFNKLFHYKICCIEQTQVNLRELLNILIKFGN